MPEPDPFDAVTDEAEPAADAGGRPDRRSRLAPIVVLVVAALLAGLFVVLAGSNPSTNESAETYLMDRPAPEAVGVGKPLLQPHAGLIGEQVEPLLAVFLQQRGNAQGEIDIGLIQSLGNRCSCHGVFL